MYWDSSIQWRDSIFPDCMCLCTLLCSTASGDGYRESFSLDVVDDDGVEILTSSSEARIAAAKSGSSSSFDVLLSESGWNLTLCFALGVVVVDSDDFGFVFS